MDLPEAIDLVVADTREGMGEPAMSYHDAMELAFEADIDDAEAVVEDPQVVEAYRVVYSTARDVLEAALPADTTPAAEPDQGNVHTSAQYPAFTGDLAADTDTAVRACQTALQELDRADGAAAERQHNVDLAHTQATEQDLAAIDRGTDTEMERG